MNNRLPNTSFKNQNWQFSYLKFLKNCNTNKIRQYRTGAYRLNSHVRTLWRGPNSHFHELFFHRTVYFGNSIEWLANASTVSNLEFFLRLVTNLEFLFPSTENNTKSFLFDRFYLIRFLDNRAPVFIQIIKESYLKEIITFWKI